MMAAAALRRRCSARAGGFPAPRALQVGDVLHVQQAGVVKNPPCLFAQAQIGELLTGDGDDLVETLDRRFERRAFDLKGFEQPLRILQGAGGSGTAIARGDGARGARRHSA